MSHQQSPSVTAATVVSYVLSPALSSREDGLDIDAKDNDKNTGSGTASRNINNEGGKSGNIGASDGAEYLERIRTAQQTTIANLSSASAKITHMTQESDRLLQASMVAFQNHVMTMSRVQADLTALQGRISQCVGRAERIKAVDEKLASSSKSVVVGGRVSSPPQTGGPPTGGAINATTPDAVVVSTECAKDDDGGIISGDTRRGHHNHNNIE